MPHWERGKFRLTQSYLPDDAVTPVLTLRQAMQAFVAERAWERFHSPKNLAMSLAIEAAEVMEHVQWLDAEQSWKLTGDEQGKAALGEELADVFCYLLALTNVLNLDLTQTTLAKLEKNRNKYPVEAFRGRYGEKDPQPALPPPAR